MPGWHACAPSRDSCRWTPDARAGLLFLKGREFDFIRAFAALFAGLGLAAPSDYGAARLLVLGVFLGSAPWWAIVAAAGSWLRERSGSRFVRAINVFAGITILGLATLRLARLF